MCLYLIKEIENGKKEKKQKKTKQKNNKKKEGYYAVVHYINFAI